MEFHPNYIEALKEHYKDFSYSETIEMIKKNRLYGAASSKYTIQSLPKDRIWGDDINTDTFEDSEDANYFMESLTDEELHSYGSHTGNSEYGMWVSSKKAKLIKDNWDNEEWWADPDEEIKEIEDEFNESKGEDFKGIIYNQLFDFTSLEINHNNVKSLINSIEEKSEFKDHLKTKEVEIDSDLQSIDTGGMKYSSDIRIYYFELSFKENQNLDIITFIKDYESWGYHCDGTLEFIPYFDGKYYMKNTLTKDVKFLNPINGEWENFILEFYDDRGPWDSTYYNYTHHLSDDKFDFTKDFPQRDKSNKALKLHLENIKKYGKK
jgi:hypothetical protein